MDNELTSKKCVPCSGIGKVMGNAEVSDHLDQLKGWAFDGKNNSIFKDYVFVNFQEAVNTLNAVAEIAEAEDHHPDIHLTSYRNLNITLSTHALGGVTMNDIILAAKIEALPKALKES